MENIYDWGKEKVAPVLYAYVWWILKTAQERNIETLYFLARDGYVLKKIAELICEREKIEIECRYLYCSRKSLRIPTYAFIGEEAWDLIFLGGYAVTLASFFERVDLPKEEWDKVLGEAGIDKNVEKYTTLSDSEIEEYRLKLCTSTCFLDYIDEKSKREYPYIIKYLKQEQMLDKKIVAIVDSGWTGSMQRSLRQLLTSAGWKGNIIGFYFGMYQQPRAEDGEYLTYYFSKKTDRLNKTLFCNNLFECFLSAPHGMTIGYRNNDETYKIEPIFIDSDNDYQRIQIKNQIDGIMAGARGLLEEKKIYGKGDCQKILRTIMGHPTQQMVQVYGAFLFCDDITEKYKLTLASEKQTIQIRKELLIVRLITKLTKKKQPQMLWEYGVVAFIKNPLRKKWYWLNIFIWNYLRYFIIR